MYTCIHTYIIYIHIYVSAYIYIYTYIFKHTPHRTLSQLLVESECLTSFVAHGGGSVLLHVCCDAVEKYLDGTRSGAATARTRDGVQLEAQQDGRVGVEEDDGEQATLANVICVCVCVWMYV